MITKTKELKRLLRHQRAIKKLRGTLERPRLIVHRSINHLQAHLIDDIGGKVLFGISTLDKELKKKIKSGGNVTAATVLGEAMATKAKGKGVTKVCFDCGGYPFHGRIKAFAEAARK